MTEMQQYLGVLKQLKDFDENLSREIAAKAYQEQEKIKLEVLMMQFLIDLSIIFLFNGKIANDEWGTENREWRMEKGELGIGKENKKIRNGKWNGNLFVDVLLRSSKERKKIYGIITSFFQQTQSTSY